MSALTTRGQRDLEALEGIVQRGLATFIEVGRALAEIRDRRLYRQSHGTFEEYCHEKWLLRRTRAYQLIDAAKVGEAMSTMVDTPPTNERQARELAPLLREDQQQAVEVWRELRDEYGDDLTAKLIKRTAHDRLKRIRREREAEERRERAKAEMPSPGSSFPVRLFGPEERREHALRRALVCLRECIAWLDQTDDCLLDVPPGSADPNAVDEALRQLEEIRAKLLTIEGRARPGAESTNDAAAATAGQEAELERVRAKFGGPS
jgi:hypothetical protein